MDSRFGATLLLGIAPPANYKTATHRSLARRRAIDLNTDDARDFVERTKATYLNITSCDARTMTRRMLQVKPLVRPRRLN